MPGGNQLLGTPRRVRLLIRLLLMIVCLAVAVAGCVAAREIDRLGHELFGHAYPRAL